LSIIVLEDKHKILLHLSIFDEYQQFFQHRICFSIQPKDGDTVASAAVFGQQVYSPRLLSAISIFSAEYNVKLLALKFVASFDESKFHNQFGFSLFPTGNCKLQKSKSFH
jgi:hypothetical protein